MKKYDGGDPHGIVYKPDHIEEHASAVLLSKDVADYLEREYPGWLWALSVDPRGGVASIRSLRLSGEWGFMLKLDWIQHDPVARRRIVLAAAGEVLERFGMPVGPFNREKWLAGPRDIAGNPKPDLSDKHARVRRRYRDEALTQAVKNGEVTLRWQDSQRADGSTHRRILIASGYRNREDGNVSG